MTGSECSFLGNEISMKLKFHSDVRGAWPSHEIISAGYTVKQRKDVRKDI